ncbi:MAG: polysaccharide biosynthesis tyrosine autokinase [Bacteroidales bacterium]|jgi:capsular exopolysaccharide synthesis family protein|nr:polysaccharide biosynthesis tyrosine autokinase [Bacteroidales bacterium]
MTTQTNEQQEEQSIDIKKYIYLITSHWYWFALSIVACLIVAFIYVRYATRIFSTRNSVVLLEKDDALGSMSSIMQEFGSFGGRSQNIDNQIVILSSYNLVRQTLERLDFQVSYFSDGVVHDVEIYDNSPFTVQLLPDTVANNDLNVGLNEKIFVHILSANEFTIEIPRTRNAVERRKMLFGEVFQTPDYKFTLLKKENFADSLHVGNRYAFIVNNYNDLTNDYVKNLNTVANSKRSSIIDLSLSGNVPEKMVEFLNTHIQIAIENEMNEKSKTSLNTIRFIDEQLATITDSLAFAESNLENFRADNRIINISEEGTVILKRLEEQRSKQIALQAKIKYFNYLQKSIKDKDFHDMVVPSVVGIQDQTLNALVTQLSKLYSERQIIEFSAKENHPSLQIINSQISNAIQLLNDNVKNMIESTQIELRSVDGEIARIERDIERLPNTERQMISIQRKFQLNDNLFNFLLQKRAEVGITKAANIPNMRFVDHAILDNVKQTAPRKTVVALIALLLGFIIPIAIYLIRDFLKDTISNIDAVKERTGLPLLGSVIHNKYGNGIIVKKHPKSSIAESFRTARTNLSFFLSQQKDGCHTLALTSTVSGEGKSFCALNLAGIIAMNNKKTLVVGLDLRKPTLHKYLGINKTVGVTDYLIGKVSFEDILNTTTVPGCDIIFSGTIPPNPLELIESEGFANFMTHIKNSGYDYIILDTPPIGLIADSLSIMKNSDLNIYVVRQNYTSKSALEFIAGVRREKKIDNLCVLANDIHEGYGYGYGYGYRYSSNYRYNSYYEEHEEKPKTFLQKIQKVFNKG